MYANNCSVIADEKLEALKKSSVAHVSTAKAPDGIKESDEVNETPPEYVTSTDDRVQ